MKRLNVILVVLFLIASNIFAQGCFADKNGKESFKIVLNVGASDELLKFPKGTTYQTLCEVLHAKKYISGRPVDGGKKYSFDYINNKNETVRVIFSPDGTYSWKVLE